MVEISIIEMTQAASVSLLRSEFDDFLFASIGEERNGMQLSVLSALARLDVDPWQAAAELARLPKATATQRLASLIAALPDRPLALDPGTIAARLIARLPRRASSNTPSREMLLGVGLATLYVTLIASLLGAPWIIASRQPPAQVDNTHAPESDTVFQRIGSAELWQATITWAGATGDMMTNDKMQPNVNDRPAEAKPEPADQKAQQSQAGPLAQPEPRPVPGRRPLFGR